MQYGNVKNGAGRILPRGKSNDWAHKRPPHGVKSAFVTFEGATKRDTRKTTEAVSYPPELMQVARAFGIHPREVLKRIKLEKRINALAEKFN